MKHANLNQRMDDANEIQQTMRARTRKLLPMLRSWLAMRRIRKVRAHVEYITLRRLDEAVFREVISVEQSEALRQIFRRTWNEDATIGER